MNLFAYVNKKASVELQYRDKIEAAFKTESFKKRTILLKPDSWSQKVIFVESGLLRMYYQVDNKIVTFLFLSENAIMFPLESVIYNKPDPYGWEVLQDCILRTVLYQDVVPLIESIPNFERFFSLESFKVLKQMSDKLYGIQMQNAEERYKNLLQNYPDILLSAPLGHIASYLGISQQHLSVIRAKK